MEQKVQQAGQTINLDLLVDDIYNKRCVLLLGPSLEFFEKRPGRASLCDYLMRSILLGFQRRKLAFDAEQSNNLLYLLDYHIANSLDPETHKRQENFIRRLADFCNRTPVSALYSKIASLPFHTIISTSPDNFLHRASEAGGFEYNEDDFQYRLKNTKTADVQSGQAIVQPVEEKATYKRIKLIYNLCGSLKKGPDTLVLNEQDQVRYLQSIITHGPPSNVLGRLDSKKSYLFLDFDFDDWQFRLLMEILNPTKGDANILYAPRLRKNLRNGSIVYFTKRFKMEYLNTDTYTFINDLLQHYTAKFGDPNRKFMAYIAYADKDTEHVVKLRFFMENSSIAKRVTVQSNEVDVGTDKAAKLKANFDQSEIYIPLISYDFLSDRALRAQLDEAIQLAKQRKKKIFPIILGNIDYKKMLPGLVENSALILPYSESAAIGLAAVLNAAGNERDGVYEDLVKLINSEIK